MTEARTEDEKQLTVQDPSDLLLVLLYAPGQTDQFGEPIEGLTRLQKLIFLLQKEKLSDLVSDIEEYPYEANKYGPYSSDLIQEIEDLKSAGIIKTERLKYTFTDDSDSPGDFDPDIDVPPQQKEVTSSRFYLSPELGMQIGEELWSSLGSKKKELKKFKTFFNSISLRQLLIYTYDRYDDYTGESVIKENLPV